MEAISIIALGFGALKYAVLRSSCRLNLKVAPYS